MYPEIYNDKTDILFYFLARACKISSKYVSFIVSRAFLEAYKADKLRAWLLKNTSLEEIIDFQNFYVFEGVGITTSIIRLRNGIKAGRFPVYKLKQGKQTTKYILSDISNKNSFFENYAADQALLSAAPWSFVTEIDRDIISKIDASGVPIGQILIIGQGMQTGRNEVFGKRTDDELRRWHVPKSMYYHRASNTDIQRYTIRDRCEYLLYLEDAKDLSSIPLGVQKFLNTHAAALKERAAFQRGNCLWWRYTWPLHKELYSRSKILCPYLSSENRFALDDDCTYIGLTDTTVLFENNQPEHLFYLLGLLNSRLLTFRYKSIGKLKSGGIFEYFWNGISKLPIHRINLSNQMDKSCHDRMVQLV